jgi:hypothetical protein
VHSVDRTIRGGIWISSPEEEIMKRHLPVLVVVGVLAGACGPRAIAYVGVDHPKAEGHLTADVALHYRSAPPDAQLIEHVSQTERSANCENATINALEKMQATAAGKGGNALVNLKAVWEGKDVSNEQGFWCVQSKGLAMVSPVAVYGITWEGDIATVGAPVAEPVDGMEAVVE